MDNGNETALPQCRFLTDDYFPEYFQAFTEAFSDYVIPIALTEAQFRNHLNLTSVDLSRSVGCLDQDKLIGFSLNGFGIWAGKSTVYDAGTGVIPTQRRKGLSESMFSLMLPVLKADGLEQFLLEVVTTNHGAISLYEKLGFQSQRTLSLLQCDGPISSDPTTPDRVEIRELVDLDWELMTKFWDGQPSWQNSVEAIKRSRPLKQILGAFEHDRCVGYIVFSSKFGRIAQIAVSQPFRNRGIGTALVRAMQDRTADGFSLQVINIDTSINTTTDFFHKRGFYERLSQHEMIKTL